MRKAMQHYCSTRGHIHRKAVTLATHDALQLGPEGSLDESKICVSKPSLLTIISQRQTIPGVVIFLRTYRLACIVDNIGEQIDSGKGCVAALPLSGGLTPRRRRRRPS
jgi:hypothetical protein